MELSFKAKGISFHACEGRVLILILMELSFKEFHNFNGSTHLIGFNPYFNGTFF